MLKSTFFFLIFLNVCIYSQKNSNAAPVEIFVGMENNDPSHTLIVNSYQVILTAQGQVWGGDRVSPSEIDFWMTEDYQIATDIPDFINESENKWEGFDFVLEAPISYDQYAYSFYKVTTEESGEYFYLDYRDNRYGMYENFLPPSFGHNADIWIKYNVDTDKFFLKSDASFDYEDPIANGSILNIWDIKQKGLPVTNLFPDFWQNCLAVGYHYDENNPQPLQILWGRYPDENHYTYYLFREIDSGGFVLIGVFNSSSFNYQDKSILSL